MLLEPLVFETLFLEMSTVNSFSTGYFENIVEPMVLATLCLYMLQNQWFQQHYFWKCYKTIGFRYINVGNVVKPIVLATWIWEML